MAARTCAYLSRRPLLRDLLHSSPVYFGSASFSSAYRSQAVSSPRLASSRAATHCRLSRISGTVLNFGTAANRSSFSRENLDITSKSNMPESKTEVAEYGAWKSPITSALAAGSSISFMDLQTDSCVSLNSDVIYWMEVRPSEAGRGVICSWNPDSAKTVEWTPKEYNVKTKVHEYGGGSFCVFNGEVFFVNKADQRIYAQKEAGKEVRAVTGADSARRFADLFYSEQFGKLFAVCEDRGVRENDPSHNKAEDKCAMKTISDNYIVAVDPQNGSLKHIIGGSDFYACPRVSSLGLLIWMEWNFPNMPWDNTMVKWTKLNIAGDKVDVGEPVALSAKNGQKDVAFTFPSFAPSGKILYISDETDWWNLYLTEEDQAKKECLDQQGQDLGHPLWIFGMCPYDTSKISGSDDTAVVMSYGKEVILLRLDGAGALARRKVIETGFKFHDHYLRATPHGCYAIGYDAKTPSTLLYVDYKTEKVCKVRVSSDLQLEGYLSEPQEIEFATGSKEVAYGYFYPPINKDYQAPAGSKPPVLVKMHGGPTSNAYATLSPKIQYYTSRGFGVLDVNYRGSSGYGRKYRQKLNKNWGVSDVEDAVNGARYLVEKGLADKNRLCITGSSAGGLSVLNALLHHGIFKAGTTGHVAILPWSLNLSGMIAKLRIVMQKGQGRFFFVFPEDQKDYDLLNYDSRLEATEWKEGASHYGVTDLEALVADFHKFEMRFFDIIIGEYPAEKKIYEERSPIHNKEKLKCPVIFFQGTDDAIVPPIQAEKMYEAVKSKGLPCALVLFEGEGHGFTNKDNIQKALDAEYAFFVQVFGINAPHVTCDVVFENTTKA